MEVLQQVLRYTTQHTAGESEQKTKYSSSKDDLAWLGTALEAVGKEESERLASHQQCLIEHQSKGIAEVLEALEYMEDFVETYDSALGWIQAGGADLVLDLLSSTQAQVFIKTCSFLSTLLQNHIPVQKAVYASPVGTALLHCFGGLEGIDGAPINETFKTEVFHSMPSARQPQQAPQHAAAAAAVGGSPAAEHAAWQAQNTAAATTTSHTPDEAAAAVSKTTAQWGHMCVSSVREVTALLSAVSCLTRAADIIEEHFVHAHGVRSLAALWCHSTSQRGSGESKLRRKCAVFTKALLMRAPLRGAVAGELLQHDGFWASTAPALSDCVQGGELHELDLLENTLYILQHLAVHASVQRGASAGLVQGRAALPALQAALGEVLGSLPADSQSNKQISAITKALLSAFAQ